MNRTVKIDGKPFELVKMKWHKKPFGKPRSTLRKLLDAMQIGESVLIEANADEIKRYSVMMAHARTDEKQYRYRSEGNGFRIYCTKTEPAQRKRLTLAYSKAQRAA